jgi:DNA-binding response OmpR family regulator
MRILVIEDEFLLAVALEAALEVMGHDVLGPAATIEDAMAILDGDVCPDGAILDLNLRGRSSVPLAFELAQRQIPFIFSTGYDDDGTISRHFPTVPWLRKPYTDSQLRRCLASLSRLQGALVAAAPDN